MNNYKEFLDFIIYICNFFEKNSSKNIAFIVKNSELLTIYQSENYNLFSLKYGGLEETINKAIKNNAIVNEIEQNFVKINIIQFPSYKTNYVIVIHNKTSKEKSTPIDNISKFCHDIQEPLRNVANFLQLISYDVQKFGNSDDKKYISYTVGSINKIKKWIEESISISNKKTTKVYINNIIDEIEQLLQYQIKIRKCSIVVESGLPAVSVIKSEISNLFKNLIENSLKHAIVDDELLVKISKNSKKTNDKALAIFFEDNGQKKINTEQKKSCIGMSICADIAESNGFYIENIGKNDGCYKYEIIFPRSGSYIQ